METVVKNRHIERRATARRPVDTVRGLQARIRPGHSAAVINVSSGGALVETTRRLLPHSFVEIFMDNDSRRANVRGRVLRCGVADVRPNSVRYRAAIQFDSYLPWFIDQDDEPVGEGGVVGHLVGAAGRSQG